MAKQRDYIAKKVKVPKDYKPTEMYSKGAERVIVFEKGKCKDSSRDGKKE